MFRKLLHTIPLLFLLSHHASADVLWQYGVDDNNARGRLNAVEFNSDPEFVWLDPIEISSKGTVITDGPGYLHDSMTFKQICTSLGLRCQNHIRDFQTSSELIITYSNQTANECTNVTLTYDRHGTEHNQMYFINMSTEQTDEFEFRVGGKEAQQLSHTVALQNIPPFVEMQFWLLYEGNGKDNGHFIDMIRLEADGC